MGKSKEGVNKQKNDGGMWIGNTQCRDNILAATHRVYSLRARRVRPSYHGYICGPQRHEYLKEYLGKF